MTTLAPLPPLRALPDETLSGIVDTIILRPDIWEPLATRPEGERVARLLTRDEQIEVWVISWADGHDTGFHDHGGSTAAVAVARGELVEERLRIGAAPLARRLVERRRATIVPAEDVHRAVHRGGPPAVSVHAYSPPLQELGAYRVGPSGLLQRLAQSGDTMLEPATTERHHAGAQPEAT
jgi:hypothetical protein